MHLNVQYKIHCLPLYDFLRQIEFFSLQFGLTTHHQALVYLSKLGSAYIHIGKEM